MNDGPSFSLTRIDYWCIVCMSALAPLIGFWIENAWVFRREIRHYQALLFYVGEPYLWLVTFVELCVGCVAFVALKGVLRRAEFRWAIFVGLCGLWTYVAFLIMPGVRR